MRAFRALIPGLLLAALAGGPILASRVPEASRQRAERIRQWDDSLAAARAAAERGRVGEAESLFREVIEQSSAAGGSAMRTAQATEALADLFRADGRMVQAEPLYLAALELWERLLGESQPRVAVTLHNLGVVQSALGNWEAAARTLGRALAIWETSLGADSAEARNTRRAREAALAELGPR